MILKVLLRYFCPLLFLPAVLIVDQDGERVVLNVGVYVKHWFLDFRLDVRNHIMVVGPWNLLFYKHSS